MSSRKLAAVLVLFSALIPVRLCAAPELRGFDGRSYSMPTIYFRATPTTASAGSIVSLAFFVANFGDAASGVFTVRLYLSKDATIDPSSDYALTSHVSFPNLDPGKYNGSTSFNVQLPAENVIAAHGGAGGFYIGMFVDSQNQVAESNESNNRNLGDGADRTPITVSIPQPDLVGFDGRPSYPTSYFDAITTNAVWGDLMDFRLAVWNQTGGNAATFKAKVFLSEDGTIDPATDYVLYTLNFTDGLPGLNYSTYFGQLQLPSVNPFGTSQTNFTIGMVVDADSQVAESNESNNRNQGAGKDLDPSVILNPTPDIQATDSVTPGSDLMLAFSEVANDGAGNARGLEAVTLINKGKASLVVSNITLSGSAAFTVTEIASSVQNFISPSSFPRVLAANGSESWVISVQFDPTTSGTTNGALTVASNDPDTPALAVSLTGTGVPVPDIARSGSEAGEVDFGGVVRDGAGGFTSVRTVTLKNTGSGPLTVSQNGISLLNGTHYGLVSVTSSTQGGINLAAAPAMIAAQNAETWDVVVRFDPANAGRLNDGLRIVSDDPDEEAFTVSLTGVGQEPMQLVVADSSGAPDDRAIAFPDTHADGTGQELSAATLTLKNAGDAVLTVAANGLSLASGAHFHVQSVVSDKSGPVNLAAGADGIEGCSNETWTVTVVFDPAAGGSLTDTLNIDSDDPATPSVVVALSGQGLVRPALSVTDSDAASDDFDIDFGAVLNDGSGGRTAQKNLTLKNIGAQALVVAQNGIEISGGGTFTVTGVVSSTRGAIDLGSASDVDRTLAPVQAETWTVTVAFDPAAEGAASATLQIASNDPANPTVGVALHGSGSTPAITLNTPAVPLNVAAGSVYALTWTDSYAGGDASVSLYLDADTNPADGLIEVASGISEDSAVNAYDWRVDPTLSGGTYHVYAVIADGAVTNGDYAAGTLTVDPTGSFVLRSPTEVTSPDYAYEYEYAGQIYTGVRALHAGYNSLIVSNGLPGGGTASFQFGVNLVPSLIHAERMSHDELNRVVEVKNGNGIATTLTYDQLSRMVKRASSNGAVVEFAYDVLGRRTTMTDYTGTTFYEWDDLDRLTAVITSKNATRGDSDDLALRYEYDLAGRKTAIVYPGGERTQYTYDAAGRMLTVNNVTRSLLFTYAYNPTNGLLKTLTRPNGIDTDYAYDGMGRLTNILHRRTGGELVVNFGYVLDAAGKATEFRTTEAGGVERVECYTYDRFDRLCEVVYSEDSVLDDDDKTVTYTYDGNGNRLSMTTRTNNVMAEVRLYEYGNENRLLRVTDGAATTLTEYGYDAAGNTIRETTAERTRFFSYDERNLMTSVIDGSNHVTYAYNGDGQRIGKTVNGETTTFVNDINRPVWETVQELDGASAVEASFTFGGRRIAACEGAVEQFELTDRLGSVRITTDDTAVTQAGYVYDSFGAVNVIAGSMGRFLCTGERVDPESGFVFLRARHYAPAIGRFTTKDPLGVAADLNSYAYCSADPINRTDPLGLDSYDDLLRSMFPNVPDGPVANPNTPSDNFANNITSPFHNFFGGMAQGEHVDVNSDLYRSLSPIDKFAVFHDKDMILRGGEGFNLSDVGKMYRAAYSSPSAYFDTAILEVGLIADVVVDSVRAVGSWLAEGARAGGTSGFGYDGGVVRDLTSLTRQTYAPPPPPPPGGVVGGVLIDKAAQLVGSNLSDLRGAVYDPVSGQFVFLGTEGSAAVKDIDLDYLWTALNAVYGSAVPPFVTLDPPAWAYNKWTDYGDGDGVFEPGENNGFMVAYNPIWSEEDHTCDIDIKSTWSGSTYLWKARFDCLPANVTAGGRRAMKMAFKQWVLPPPTGVTLDTWPWQSNVWVSVGSFRLSSSGQESYTPFTLNNASSSKFIVTDIRVIPDRQHRKFGGRVENTRLGWVMLEADRVMKCLSVGRDNLVTNITYNSGTVSVAGYSNMTERGGIGNIRMWFTPNEMTLKRHLDPDTGRASIVFDQASVALNTESMMMGLPQPPEARAFADHFTANYDAFAAMDFPCVDPDDPTGTAIVNVKVFDMLKDAMQAVSLARFFRDNDVPVDMWWLNSWQPEIAYSPRSCATAYNEENGMIIYGGVQVNKPNTYVPSATARSVADVVQSSRPDVPADPSQDIQEQVWTAETDEGDLKAVAAQTDAEPQDGNIRLAEVDLSFASPGALPLQFTRFYQSAWLGRYQMGPGWRYTPFALEFERPSWFDENGLMKDGSGTAIWKDASKNTRLRSGVVRVVDLRSGAALDFASSLVLGYAVDNIGNAVITVSGLGGSNLPTFSPGIRKSGATLVQLTDERKYRFTSPDGAKLTFDYEGRLLQSEDRNGKKQTYAWNVTKGLLLSVTDDASQKLTLSYNAESNRVVSVSGPASEQVNYTYTAAGCLERATHLRSGGYVQYSYNTDNQLVGKRMYNGLDVFTGSPDLRGRPNETADLRSNTLERAFSLDFAGAVRTTETSDPLVTATEFVPWQQRFDREGRLLASRDATGAETLLGYETGSLLPNSIDLPIAGRPAIGIERNDYGQPMRVSDPGNAGAEDVTASYDAVTRLLTGMSDQAGRNTELAYDAKNNVTRVRRHLGVQPVDVGYSYTTSGALQAMTNALGATAVTIYRDSVDRATNVVDATGVAIRYQYDGLGRLWKVYDPRLSGPMEYVYDNFDRIIRINYPIGFTTSEYDPVKGWLVRQTDVLGRSTRYVRDPATGDILQVIDEVEGGADRTTALTYNRFGQLESVTPPDAQPVSFAYDQLGRPLGSNEADAMPPGAPKALDSDCAEDGVPTFSTTHRFSWGAPESDSGIVGYSIGYNEIPDEVVDTVGATSTWASVSVGNHTFSVRAKGNNGLWGDAVTFDLIIRPMSDYDAWRVGKFTSAEADNDAVSGPNADPDGDGMINENEYIADTDPKEKSSLLQITGLRWVPTGMRIDWKGGRLAKQVVESRAVLGGNGVWRSIVTNLPPTPLTTNVIDTAAGNQGFYRIRAER